MDGSELTRARATRWFAVDAAFSEAKIDEMVEVLKERGIFRFLTRYITEERIPIHKLLLIFGARVVSLRRAL